MHAEPHATEPPFAATLPVPSVIDQQIERDLALLELLMLRCGECEHHGPSLEGGWVIAKSGDGIKVFCATCAAPAGGS